MPKPERKPAPDPLIDEVRLIRRELSEQFGNDPDKLCEYLRGIEREHGTRVARPTDRRSRAPSGSGGQ